MHSTYERVFAYSYGGPEVMQVEQVDDLPEPNDGEVRVRVEAAGVGYTDTIVRRGKYIAYKDGLPLTPGYDMVGLVDKLGHGVSGLSVGQRVADMPVHGAYSQYMIRPAVDLVPVPPGIEPAAAVEVPLMWMTAWQMLTRCVSLHAGDTILVVGASGSTGRALVALARHLGLRVIGTCSAINLASVEALGAIAIDYRRPDLQLALDAASDGKGVSAAFDAVGGASWQTSWRSLATGGTLVGYGLQDWLDSGAAIFSAGISLARIHLLWKLFGKVDGSRRRTIFYDIRVRRQSHHDEYASDVSALFTLIADGTVVPPEAEVLPLHQAAEAHRRIAAGGLRGRLVLAP